MLSLTKPLTSVAKSVKKALSVPSNREIVTKKDEEGCFHLILANLVIGVLSVHDGMWKFEYTKVFKDQVDEGVKPLTSFPNIDEIYQANDLWPSFAVRIPSLEQPSVQQIIAKKNIDKQSSFQLLKHFGKETISNPFRLEFQENSY